MGKELAERKKRAYELHALIGQAAKKTVEGILEIGVALKQMRDEKLYKELGHKKFESYTVEEWNMSQRQAYNYIETVEKLPRGFLQRVAKVTKPLSFRRLLALPNDTEVLEGLSENDLDTMAGMSDEEYEAEMTKLKKEDYDRDRNGGRGPSDVERPKVSRDRYRDQRKKIVRFKEKIETMHNEKDELIGVIEGQEKQIEELKRASSPDNDKNKLIQENKKLLLRIKELEQQTDVDNAFKLEGEVAMREMAVIVGECAIVLNKCKRIELHSHEEYVEFRAWTDAIRRLIDETEDYVAFVMGEKGLHPKEYEEYRDGSFKYHMDKATEDMRKDYTKKEQKRIDEIIKKGKEERKRRRENSPENTSGDS